jgi:hypothetical protein
MDATGSMKKQILAVILCALLAAPAQAVTTLSKRQKAIEDLGTGVAIALPVIAGGITLFKHDPKGSLQLVVETALTVGTAFALKNIVREKRPDGSDYQSFPSDTTALFVSYSRVQAKQHHWYDTLASSAIAAGYAYEIGTPFKKRYNITTELEAAPDGGLVRLSYQF